MNPTLFMALMALQRIADAAADNMDQMLFYVMIGLWVIMPIFIVYEELQERKALKEAEEDTVANA
jgi:RNAse (barnase) inhibitor barstar